MPPQGCGNQALSVLSWNLLAPSYDDDSGLSWADVRWPAMQRCLADFASVDVLCFQEVDVALALEGIRSCLAPLGFECVVQDRQGFPVVNAIFFKASRFRVTWVEHRSRAMLLGLALVGDGSELGIANLHLQAGPRTEDDRQRESQLSSALKRLRERQSCMQVVCGDFNSSLDEGSGIAASIEQAGLRRNPWTGPTYRDEGYADTLDHICVSATLRTETVLDVRPASSSSLASATSRLPDHDNPSDHLPIAVRYSVLPVQAPRVTPPPAVSDDVRGEWMSLILETPRKGSSKQLIREHRRLERLFLDCICQEEAESLKAWSASATEAAAALVRAASRRALCCLAERETAGEF